MMFANRLGRPKVFQLSQDVSFNDLAAALLTNLSDPLRDEVQSAVSSTHCSIFITLITHHASLLFQP